MSPVSPATTPSDPRPTIAIRRGWAGRVLMSVAVAAVSLGAVSVVGCELHHLFLDRQHLPDAGPLARFEFPTVGRVYDAEGRPLAELAREARDVTPYEAIPPIVQGAIVAVEDKRFFLHNGIDYLSLSRVVGKARFGVVAGRLARGGWSEDALGAALFPQGGSSITQQLVRGVFLSRVTARENSYELRSTRLLARALASVLGARSVNMLARKREEIRLSLWLEQDMRRRFGSKRRAKEEILARYTSFVYMGSGQFGFARAAEYYFGRTLASFTEEDADKAAVLAGIAKAPRDYAPTASDPGAVLRRRNETLVLMEASGALSAGAAARARDRPLGVVRQAEFRRSRAPAIVEHVLAELSVTHPDLGVEDLLLGRINIHATADARIQALTNDALEGGLAQYEQRYPAARGIVQGSVVVLHNQDGRILAETGGRRVYRGRSAIYTDFNRVTRSLRQPGSAMKPLVYLAAFQHGGFTLDTVVPDLPISVSNGADVPRKWIANYDGRFKGPIPVRQALAESRNAVAIWISQQVGIDQVLQTSRGLGVQTPLGRYPATALGGSEMNLLELANAYRAMASGIAAEPFLIRTVVRDSGEEMVARRPRAPATQIDTAALALVQEGLRGVVRLPGGTAHALDSPRFGIAVMGKTGTTNGFRDAVFVGSTYGPAGITVAVRIGFDDNRSLGAGETGGRLALPVFQQVLRGVYSAGWVGAAPAFPVEMEARITAALSPPDLPAPPGVPVLLPVSLAGWDSQ